MMLRGRNGLAIALALTCALAACKEEETEPNPEPTRPTSPGPETRAHPSAGRSWTFLVYMVADNNLEPAALNDIIEMAAVGSGTDFNIVLQIDRAQGYDESGLGPLPNWTSTKRLRVTPGGLEELEDLGELNMGAPQTLADFITWGAKTYPADRYALVFWDHGGAWPGFGGDDSTQDGDLLSIAELKAGIQAGMGGASLQQFALIGYDACLMSTYEVALAMRPFGEYLLASEELEPGHGWDYRALQVLNQDPSTSPLTLGQQLIQGFQTQAQVEETSANITLALTDLYALDDLVLAVDQLAALFPAGTSATTATAFGRGREATLKFNESPDPSQSSHMVDLGHLSEQLAAHALEAGPARDSIQAALAKAVVARTNGPRTASATGLSIYFPPRLNYYRADYAALTEVATWRDFLTRYFREGAPGVIPTFLQETAEVLQTPDGFTFRGQLSSGAAEFITVARLYHGYARADNSLVVLGDRPAFVVGSGDQAYVESTWNLTALKLTQGVKSGYAYLSLEADTSGAISAIIPFAYLESPSAQAQYALRVLLIDPGGNVTQDTFYVESQGVFGELFPVPGAILLPLVQIFDANGNATFDVLTEGDAAFDATLPISLGVESLSTGTNAFGILAIEDYRGEGDQAYNIVVVP
ncbi:MAG: hypothetical protein JXB05_20770 [Myxococcaceae bacterium]|nr:hypothetical protein [Myxococcaceae bacterium]